MTDAPKPLHTVPWPSSEALSRAGDMIGRGAIAASRAGVTPPEGELDRLLFEAGRTRGQALDAAADLVPAREEGAMETDRARTFAERIGLLVAMAREGAAVRSTLDEVARSAAGLTAMADDVVVVVDEREPRPREARLEVALRDALGHIEHMARWIGGQNAGYSFEGLGEDMPAMQDALAPPLLASPPADDPLRATRAALFMCAASCQGGHSDAGAVAAEILGIDFPVRMDALWARAVSEGFKPEELWPWLAKRRRERAAAERRQRDVSLRLAGASAGNETKDAEGEGE